MHYARRAFVLGALAMLATQASGCVTPQIPLPPPSVDKMSLDIVDASGSLVRLMSEVGGVPANSRVTITIIDDATGCFDYVDCQLSFGADRTDGHFTSPTFVASDGSQLLIEFTRADGRDSDAACVNVDYSTPNTLQKCPSP